MGVDLLMWVLKSAHYIELPDFIVKQRDSGINDKNRLQSYKEYRNVAINYFWCVFKLFRLYSEIESHLTNYEKLCNGPGSNLDISEINFEIIKNKIDEVSGERSLLQGYFNG